MLDMSIAEYDSHWNRLEETKVELKDACFAPHDFGITPKHFVFFQVRLKVVVLPQGILTRLHMATANSGMVPRCSTP